jgi:serine protease
MSYRLLLVAAMISIMAGTYACQGGRQTGVDFSYQIDTSLSQPEDELPGLSGGAPRHVGSMVSPDGRRDDFALNEVIMVPRDQDELDEFLSKYQGKVLRTGLSQPIEGLSPPDYRPTTSGVYLVEVNLDRSSLDDFNSNMERADVNGQYTFSSEEAARLAALLARERALPIGPNILVRGGATREHETATGANLDATAWPWMTEDDNPATPAEDGLSVGVARAWDYLSYKKVRGSGAATYTPTYVAIIDGGFALDQTGRPTEGNTDFYYYGSKPIQADMVDNDGTAGGENRTRCTGGDPCPWHGQNIFGVLGALPSNAFGSAGTGGPVVVPILIKVDWTWYGVLAGMYSLADAIRSAVLFGSGSNRADVISISITTNCFRACGLTELGGIEDFADYMQRTVLTATSFGAVVVANAGNEGWDLDSDIVAGRIVGDWIPCELDHVICVGAVQRDSNPKSDSNYGSKVDIWAPTNILSTTDPDTVRNDDDDNTCDELSNDQCDELKTFGGTSASTPFVAGIVALMTALDKNLPSSGELPTAGTGRVQAIQQILQDTANRVSFDPKVSVGHVDAFRAVAQVRENTPPIITPLGPQSGSTVGWQRSIPFSVEYTDPEVSANDIYRWAGEVVFESDLDGVLCKVSQPPYNCSSTLDELTIGTHRIIITALDPFGASDAAAIQIEVVNRPPQPEIMAPEPGATLYSTIPTQLRIYLFDPDEYLDNQSVSWTSSVDGPLGTGRRVEASLSTGHHIITARTVDGKGLVVDATVAVDVKSGAGLPRPTIVHPGPDDPCCFSPGEVVTLQGEALDDEDGPLFGESLEWHSSRDGFLGTGGTLSVTLSGPEVPCEPEMLRHQITLLAKDSDDHEMSVVRQVAIGEVC